MKIILQHDQRDCGAACLAMISAHYGRKLPISRCRELTKTDKTGANVYGLVDGAKQIGLEAQALSGSPEELLDGLGKGDVTFPFVAHTVSENAMLHFVVVFGFKNGRLLIGDPGKGKLRLTREEYFRRWTGYVVTFRKTESFQPGNETKGSFAKFFLLLKGQYGKLAGVLAISLVIAAIGIMGAYVFQIAIDDFARGQGYYEEHGHEEEHSHEHSGEEAGESEENAGGKLEQAIVKADSMLGNAADKVSESIRGNLSLVFLCVLALYALQAAIQLVRGWLIVSVSRKIDLRLTLQYYNHIADLPVSSIAMRQTGEYLARFSDSAAVRQAISGATLTLMLDSVMALAGGVILYLQNRRLFMIALLMVAFYALIVFVYRKPVERSNRRVMEDNARLQSYFKESIDGMETVKAACAVGEVKETTRVKFHRFLDSVVKNSMISISQDTLADTVELMGTVLILWLGFAMVLANQASIGALMTFYVLLGYFTQPIKNLIELQPTIQTAVVAADRLNDILDLSAEPEGGASLEPVSLWELKDVDFRYGNRELTLHHVNLTVRRGEKVAVVGESGSGKTTLAKLFLRFYRPEQGEILLDGKPIEGVGLSALRRGVAYVGQNTFLFSDTIRNNLKLGTPLASDEELKAACAASRADEFITNLSGGQRQRLAIARALLKKPQLLILDEATSNLDTMTETGIKNTVFSWDDGMTCLIIAHRLSTIRNCDRIYVLDQGEVVESGTHEELLSQGGKYASLWRSQ